MACDHDSGCAVDGVIKDVNLLIIGCLLLVRIVAERLSN